MIKPQNMSYCNSFLVYKTFLHHHFIYLNLSPLITTYSPTCKHAMHTQNISFPKKSCSACSNEKGVNCFQVRLCWCVLAGAAFVGVEKHREICSAVLPLSTMEDSRGWLTGFGAASGIQSQDPDHSSLCLSEREVALHTPPGLDEPLDLSAPDALFV